MPFAITIFISAFLLFQVQPLIARYILPWFGGSPTVWSTCMLFFQVGLLIGYSYAHLLTRLFPRSRQIIIHCVILTLTLLSLPITPGDHLRPEGGASPIFEIISLLLSTVGMPYIIISSTGPLLQQWFAKQYPGRSPYRLYALSNIGSLLGLLTYPFIVEPNIGLTHQTWIWSAGYGLFVLCCFVVAGAMYKKFHAINTGPAKEVSQHKLNIVSGCMSEQSELGSASCSTYSGTPSKQTEIVDNPTISYDASDETDKKAKGVDLLLWILLSTIGSTLLLAATNFICQDIAVIPFFWIAPLSLYLITFIIAFDNPRWYQRWIWLSLLLISTPILFIKLGHHYGDFDITKEVVSDSLIFLSGMFIAVMVCHGEMVRLKPGNQQITLFYLMISLGGALGGLFVTFAAPILFNEYWEWPLALAIAPLLALFSYLRSPGLDLPNSIKTSIQHLFAAKYAAHSKKALMLLLAIEASYCLIQIPGYNSTFIDGVIDHKRNFYGVLRIVEEEEETLRHRKVFYHGQINHGSQFISDQFQHYGTSYYSPISGIGLVLKNHPKRKRGQPFKMGVVGLGTGTLNVYCKAQDHCRFYEIDPDVETFARKHFTFLSGPSEKTEVILGDARISMAQELQSSGSNAYDVLVVDAFSGDAIPIHLLTKEAFALYQNHLSEDGTLAIHISNRYFSLEPLLYKIAQTLNMEALLIENDDDDSRGIDGATWVILSNNRRIVMSPHISGRAAEWGDDIEERATLWSDDFSNVIEFMELE